LIPLRDRARSRALPAVTSALIALCAGVFWFELAAGAGLDELVHRHALIPARFLALAERIGPLHFEVLSPLVSSMFLHADPCHFAGNMLFLWIFGGTVEDRLGHAAYLALYLTGGIAAALSQIAAVPASTVPTLGASGAIAAVMGASLVHAPEARPHILVYLGLWLVLQVVHSVAGGGVAWWAHVGGFAFGAAVVLIHARWSRA
jgi:hypothetical protein